MHSRPDPGRAGPRGAALAFAFAWTLGVALGAAATAARAADPAAAPIAEVRRVIAEMNADPALNGQHTEHELRWKQRAERKRNVDDAPPWFVRLVRWFADASRALVWVLGAIGVAIVAVSAWRWASVRSDALRDRTELRPSHVNELDIRPESLPGDIGAAAAALARHGERRAALSLLYRGALSRLVHDHRVPIGAASTEGECVQLAARALPGAAAGYFGRVVNAWQTEVYAGRGVPAADVIAVCDAFDAHFAQRLGVAPQPAVATE